MKREKDFFHSFFFPLKEKKDFFHSLLLFLKSALLNILKGTFNGRDRAEIRISFSHTFYSYGTQEPFHYGFINQPE